MALDHRRPQESGIASRMAPKKRHARRFVDAAERRSSTGSSSTASFRSRYAAVHERADRFALRSAATRKRPAVTNSVRRRHDVDEALALRSHRSGAGAPGRPGVRARSSACLPRAVRIGDLLQVRQQAENPEHAEWAAMPGVALPSRCRRSRSAIRPRAGPAPPAAACGAGGRCGDCARAARAPPVPRPAAIRRSGFDVACCPYSTCKHFMCI